MKCIKFSVDFFTSPIFEEDELIMLTLLSLDSENMVQITSGGEVVAIFAKESLGTYLTEWQNIKNQLYSGKITPKEYTNWKMNWSSDHGKEPLCS